MEQQIEEGSKIKIQWGVSVSIEPNLYQLAESIKTIVAFEMLSSVDEMEGRSRRREHVTARQLAIYFIKDKTTLSLKAIGGLFGGRDHSTMINAINKVGDLCFGDKSYKTQFEYLKKLIDERVSS